MAQENQEKDTQQETEAQTENTETQTENKESTADAAKDTAKKAGGKLKSILGEFKEFIAQGNVLDMAVGLIVGNAFTAIVTSLVDDILMPVIGMILAGIDFSSLGITIPWGNEPFIAIGNFLNAIITFLLTAICVFLVVKFINMFRRKKKEEPEPEPAPEVSKEEELLTEIRDLLKAQQATAQDTTAAKLEDQAKTE